MIAPPGTRPGRKSAAAPDPVAQALFAEARRRRRRIRLAAGAVAATAAVLAIASVLVVRGRTAGWHAGPARPAGSGPRHSAPGPELIWATPDGRIMIGNLSTLAARQAGNADTDSSAPLVPFGGRVYWVNAAGGYVAGAFWPRVVEALDPATGTSTDIGPGEYVFPSATGRRLYVAQTDTSLTMLSAAGGRVRIAGQLNLPPGWYLPGGAGLSVAGGIVVRSADAPTPSHPALIAVWTPATGRVRTLGRAEGAIAAWTPAGGGYSLLAWMPAACRFPACPGTITNTATWASRTLHSPLGHGFVLGGAFSPDGRRLALFANDSALAGGQAAGLAVASTVTGAVRLVPGVRMTVGEDADWVRWLPGGASLVVLANRDYLVSARTLTARPFRLAAGPAAVNFSAELLPAG